MLSQEISGHYISVFVMLMIVLLGEALLRCVAKTHSEYGGIKVCVCVYVCVCLSVCVSVWVSVWVCVCLSVCVSVSVSVSVCLSVCLSNFHIFLYIKANTGETKVTANEQQVSQLQLQLHK